MSVIKYLWRGLTKKDWSILDLVFAIVVGNILQAIFQAHGWWPQ